MKRLTATLSHQLAEADKLNQTMQQHLQRAKAAGATVVSEPADMFWGDRMASLKDPDGYVWMVATNVAEFDPANVPQGKTT